MNANKTIQKLQMAILQQGLAVTVSRRQFFSTKTQHFITITALNIKVRFAGEEPFDNITKQYNNAMEVILPQYNIQIVEIPRVESDQEVISASRVRKFLEQDNFEEIKKGTRIGC